MTELFDKSIAEKLTGVLLSEAKRQLVHSLRETTGLQLIECAEGSGIHCTNVYVDSGDESPFHICWRGFIGTSNYRDDGLFVYGAHLFPLLDGRRVYLSSPDDGGDKMPYSFRYLLLTPETGWQDLGWQFDEFGEFEHWYRETADG